MLPSGPWAMIFFQEVHGSSTPRIELMDIRDTWKMNHFFVLLILDTWMDDMKQRFPHKSPTCKGKTYII